jgi:hypothetical protein
MALEIKSIDGLVGTPISYAYAVKAGPWQAVTKPPANCREVSIWRMQVRKVADVIRECCNLPHGHGGLRPETRAKRPARQLPRNDQRHGLKFASVHRFSAGLSTVQWTARYPNQSPDCDELS